MAHDTNNRLSELYHCLRADRRRQVIKHLEQTTEDAVSVRSLARSIAANEEGVPTANATGEPYRNAYNALSQTHLRTLAAADIIIYDPKRQTTKRGSSFEIAALLIDIDTPTVELFSKSDGTDQSQESEEPDND
ncbi:hypothetical protein LPA44_12970 [Halobacterium sp. KA-4]|uniref:DUF7344 domain-containing protein n=1 Tax=Halobacterium sp. KA-4 TaxID=2896367 RepID=UPI001E585C7C|nr:hypothetical protein [Halobacterium sp. KA-4]MCD2200801.1 hypothetical protein [Halobacterium sp. KA-4]